MKKIVFIFLLISNLISAQSIDSIINDYHKNIVSNPEKARAILQRGVLLAEKAHDNNKKAIFLVKMIGQKTTIRDVKGALKQFEIAKKYCLESNNKLQFACAHSEIAEMYYYNEDLDLSSKYFKLAGALFAKAKDTIGIIISKSNVSDIYQLEGKYDLAISTLLQVSKEIDTTKYTYIKVSVLNNISGLYNKINNSKKAILYSKEALKYALKDKKYPLNIFTSYQLLIDMLQQKKQFKESGFYLNKAEKFIDSLAFDKLRFDFFKLKSEQELGLNKNYDAKKTIFKALEYSLKYNRNSNEVYSLKSNLAKIYNKEGNSQEAIKILEGLLGEAKKNQNTANIPSIYSDLSASYFKNKEYKKAFETQELFINCNDSILGKEKQKYFKDAEVKYETAKKERQLAENKGLLYKEEIKAKKKNTIISIVSLVAFFIGLSGFLIYRQQKLKNKQQEQEFELKNAIAAIETQNKLHEQRLSISRDLHDNIGAQLTFVISSIDNLKYGNKITENKINNQLTKISDFTKSTIIELRDTIWAMNNSEFTVEDLYSRILNFIEKAKSAKDDINFKFKIDDQMKTLKFSSVVGINLYRTIQEAINNAIKYSEAKDIDVEVKKVDSQIMITIKDNGKGFDKETVDFGNGFYNMKKRIEEVNGTCEIQSEPNKGTSIVIILTKNQ